MKKLISCLMLVALLLCIVPAASAAGSAYMTGPSTVRAGDTITVTFYAGGGIYGGSGSLTYDSSVLTLQSTASTMGGSWAAEVSGSYFVFYDNSMSSPITGSSSIFQATFKVSADAAPGTTISVTAAGVTLSDGDHDMGMGSVSYSATIAKPLSGNCNLKSMSVTGATISPAFSPSVTNYTASVPFTTSSISVSGVAEDEAATVSVSNPTLIAGATTVSTVTVTAENGATKTYRISVARAQDPNYKKSTNADLENLFVQGFDLSPVFNKDVTQYYIWLPYETESVDISGEKADDKATLSIGDCPELKPGFGTDIPVTVTAEDGTQKVYIITAVRAPEHEKVEEYLGGAREKVPTPEEPVEETQPETEPETVPTEEPTPAAPAAPQKKAGVSIGILILTGVIALAAGAGIMALILTLTKKSGKFD